MKKVLFMAIALLAVFICMQAVAQQKEFSKDQIVAVATERVKAEGFDLSDVTIIYDDGHNLWQEKIGVATILDESPNHGILVRGFLKNYRTVYFDFKEPLKDIWVFVDKDTGDILEVCKE